MEAQIEEARRVIFETHSIAAVAAAAASSESPATAYCTQTTLRLVSKKMLDDAAAMIDPMALLHVPAAEERAGGLMCHCNAGDNWPPSAAFLFAPLMCDQIWVCSGISKTEVGSAVMNERVIDADAITEYLDARDDFDLELFADRSLRNHGWATLHGGTYIDAIASKVRQFDIRASKQFDMRTKINLPVECKSLNPDNPLIVSRVPRIGEECRHDVIRSSRSFGTNHTYFDIDRSNESAGLALYPTDEMVGKATRQLRWEPGRPKGRWVTSDSETYDKWSQALASAQEVLEKAREEYPLDQQGLVRSFVMPVLIVSDATLWVVDYDANGVRSSARQVEETTLFVGRDFEVSNLHVRNKTYRVNHLHFCTRIGFTSLLDRFSRPDKALWERIFGFSIRKGGG